jgi:hypothetical protein
MPSRTADVFFYGLFMDEDLLRVYRPQAVLANLAAGGVIAALCYNLSPPPSPDERNPGYAAKLREVARRGGPGAAEGVDPLP